MEVWYCCAAQTAPECSNPGTSNCGVDISTLSIGKIEVLAWQTAPHSGQFKAYVLGPVGTSTTDVDTSSQSVDKVWSHYTSSCH